MSAQDTLDPNKARAIELLAQGLKMTEVAKQISVSVRTLQNWKQNKEFATRLRERFSHVRDDIQAAFNPVLDRILSKADQFLDRVFRMMESNDDKIAKVGMQFYLQSLKWAGTRENNGRGSDIGIDGMVGRYAGYGTPENSGNLDRLRKLLAGLNPDADDVTEGASGEGSGASETGKNRKAASGVREERAIETGKNECPDDTDVPRAAAPCCPCKSEGEPGSVSESAPAPREKHGPNPETALRSDHAPSASSHGQLTAAAGVTGESTTPSTTPSPDCSDSAARATQLSAASGTQLSTASGTQALTGNAQGASKPEKTGKQPWKGKGSNHVPYYRKFQRR